MSTNRKRMSVVLGEHIACSNKEVGLALCEIMAKGEILDDHDWLARQIELWAGPRGVFQYPSVQRALQHIQDEKEYVAKQRVREKLYGFLNSVEAMDEHLRGG